MQGVGHLDRQAAAGGEFTHQRGQQAGVVGQPLQHRVGEDHVERPGFIPLADVDGVERHGGQAFACGVDHVAGTVQAAHRGAVEMFHQQLGGIARAATQVDHRAGLCGEWRRAGLGTDGCVPVRRRRIAWRTSSWRSPVWRGESRCRQYKVGWEDEPRYRSSRASLAPQGAVIS